MVAGLKESVTQRARFELCVAEWESMRHVAAGALAGDAVKWFSVQVR